MHSALIYVVIPANRIEAQNVVPSFYASIEKIEKAEGVSQLGDFFWQIDFQKAPGALARIVVACENMQLQYAILPLDAEPQWIMGGPTKKMPGW